MDHQSTGLSFAIIGHQDKWSKVLHFVNSMREYSAIGALSLDKLKSIYSYIPPRDLFYIESRSAKGEHRRGVYIETFISPDELDIAHLHANIIKVKEACEYAASLNIPVVSLGGFTSIILENSGTDISHIKNTFFTTGNTLTSVFIVDGITQACKLRGLKLADCRLLIVGATGDIGSACIRYFSNKTRELLVCARRAAPLQKLAAEFSTQVPVKWSVNVNELLPQADIIICVASSLLDNCDMNLLLPHAIICDAGYPKNLDSYGEDERIFWGGMGIVQQGYWFEPDCRNEFYSFPLPNISHGCVLESIVLAMENRYEAYSKGRGNITVETMQELFHSALLHGITTAPLFNARHCWENSNIISNETEPIGTSTVI